MVVAAVFTVATVQAQELQDTLTAARVSADRMRTVMRTQTGLTRLSAEGLNTGFAVFSTPDLIKTLQLLPGVASGTELMSGLFVHGGTGGDNLLLLDGSSIYNTSHLIGLFSAFNSDVVDGVDFYKSGFPARYGGRLSSVVDVTTRDGDLYEYHGTFSLGLIDGRLQYEGPLVRGKTSFQFGLRRTWMDTITIPAIAYVNQRNSARGDKVRGLISYTPCTSNNCCCTKTQVLNQKFTIPFYAATTPTEVSITQGVAVNSVSAQPCQTCSRAFVSETPLSLTITT